MRSPNLMILMMLASVLCVGCAMPVGPAGPASPAQAPASEPERPLAPHSNPGGAHTDALLFTGPSAWGAEVESLEEILYSHGTTYREVTPAQLEAMSLTELASFSALVIPGGDAPTMTRSMSAATHAKLREAVQEQGLNYLGFCAGAWLAVAPAPAPGEDVVYGLGLVNGPVQELTALARQGREFAIAQALFPGGNKRNLLWYGGPITPDIPRGVVAKYPDGTPAISQLHSGKGFVVISGLHPAATLGVLNVLGLQEREAIAPEFAWQLLEAVIAQKELPTF